MSNNPLFYLVRILWKYSAGNHTAVIAYVMLSIISWLSWLVIPIVIGNVLNAIQTDGIGDVRLASLIIPLLLIPGLTALSWCFHGPSRLMEQRNAFMARAKYKEYLVEGVLALPAEWHTNHHSGDTIDKINKGTDALYRFGSESFMIISSITNVVGSFVVLVYFNVPAAALMALLGGVAGVVIVRFDRVLVPQYEELNRADNKIAEKVYDIISNITTVIVLRIEDVVRKDIVHALHIPFGLFRRNTIINETKWGIVGMITAFASVGVIVSYVLINSYAGVPILGGTIFLLWSYVDRINNVLFQFAYIWGDIMRQRAAVKNAEELSNEFPKSNTRLTESVHADWKTIAISNLSFSYEQGGVEKAHLEIEQASIRRGERIALVGKSGSGKTTFLKVMRQMYEPKMMRVEVDGVFEPGGFNNISHEMALIPQDPELFATTIRDNLTLGIDRSDAEINHFMDVACFREVAERLPRGLESLVVERGVNLSGGEKQRLALARGLMVSADKSILLLDEPTSSIDAYHERMIYDGIFNTFRDATIISSIHRLHLLEHFDTVWYFKNGRVVASGTLDDLLDSSEEFNELWRKGIAASKESETES